MFTFPWTYALKIILKSDIKSLITSVTILFLMFDSRHTELRNMCEEADECCCPFQAETWRQSSPAELLKLLMTFVSLHLIEFKPDTKFSVRSSRSKESSRRLQASAFNDKHYRIITACVNCFRFDLRQSRHQSELQILTHSLELVLVGKIKRNRTDLLNVIWTSSLWTQIWRCPRGCGLRQT